MTEIMNSDTLTQRLAELGLERYTPQLVLLLKSGIGIFTHPTEETTIAIGSSKFGGSPDLPKGAQWPHLYGQALDFIAQINLADVMPYGVEHHLPASGILFFFYNEDRIWKEPDLWTKTRGTVLYFEGDLAVLERQTSPEKQYYTACTLSFAPDANLPTNGELRDFGIVGYGEMTDQESEAYYELSANVSIVSYKTSQANRMFGNPDHVQGNPLVEAAGIAREDSRFQDLSIIDAEWLLLLQVDSDNNANMFFGDYGALYFCILKEDLEQRRFDRVIVVSQST